MNTTTIAAAATLSLASIALGAERDIQIRSVNFETGVFELHNCGAEAIDLSEWRFCTHDEDQVRRYTDSAGFAGVTIAPGGSFFIHTNNDATGGAALDVSALGGAFAEPMDPLGAFAIGLYFPDADGDVDFADFANPDQMGDHIQWSQGGANDPSADERSDEAVLAGLWTDQLLWIDTAFDTVLIELTDTTCSLLHSPANYDVTNSGGPCNVADLAEPFGTLDFSDVVGYLGAFAAMDPAADLSLPIGSFDFTDVVAFLTAFAAGCP